MNMDIWVTNYNTSAEVKDEGPFHLLQEGEVKEKLYSYGVFHVTVYAKGARINLIFNDLSNAPSFGTVLAEKQTKSMYKLKRMLDSSPFSKIRKLLVDSCTKDEWAIISDFLYIDHGIEDKKEIEILTSSRNHSNIQIFLDVFLGAIDYHYKELFERKTSRRKIKRQAVYKTCVDKR